MSARDCCKGGTSLPNFDPKRNFMGQPCLDHEDSTPPLSYLDQASAAPLFGHAPGEGGRDDRTRHKSSMKHNAKTLTPDNSLGLLQHVPEFALEAAQHARLGLADVGGRHAQLRR